MKESSVRAQSLPSLISNDQPPTPEGASVNILSGLSGGDGAVRRRRPRWPLAAVFVVLLGGVLVWGLSAKSLRTPNESNVMAGDAPPLDPPVSVHMSPLATAPDVPPPAEDAPPRIDEASASGIAASPTAVAVITEVASAPSVQEAPEVPAESTETSAAVDLGLVSPEAAERPAQTGTPKAPRKSVVAKKSSQAPKRAAKRVDRSPADADVDIITAIVRNASSR